MILDQRSIYGPPLRTPDDVNAHWQSWAETNGFTRRVLGERHHDLVRAGETLTAYVSDSRWVADCPACKGGIACWVENPEGCCLDCGRVYKIRFPKDWREVERVLEARPPENRHLLLGETLADLKVENLTRGVPLEKPYEEIG